MKYYVQTPAVFYSDKIILHSEKLKELYIEKLSDFCGSEYKDYFEDKIIVKSEEKSEEPSEKSVVFYISESTIITDKEQALKKIENCLSIFVHSNIKVLWYYSEMMHNTVIQQDKELSERLETIINGLKGTNITVIKEYDVTVCNNATAYYGEGSFIGKDFVNSEKPVMILNLDI